MFLLAFKLVLRQWSDSQTVARQAALEGTGGDGWHIKADRKKNDEVMSGVYRQEKSDAHFGIWNRTSCAKKGMKKRQTLKKDDNNIEFQGVKNHE